MSWFNAFLAAISAALVKIVSNVLTLIGVKRLGRLEAENEALQAQAQQIQRDNEVLKADPTYPDRYLRD